MFTSLISGNTTYFSCIKYANVKTITSSSSSYYLLLNNIIIFRLADIILLKAEAETAKPTPDYAKALTLVNEIRKRAGLTSYSGLSGMDLLDTITAERGRELFLEGSRYYDLIRNERITGVSQFPYMTHSQFLQGKYLWPFDPTLFVYNSKLIQNSYWSNLSN